MRSRAAAKAARVCVAAWTTSRQLDAWHGMAWQQLLLTDRDGCWCPCCRWLDMAPSSSWLLQWLVAMQRPLQALGSGSSSGGSLSAVQLAQALVALAELELTGRVPAAWLNTWCTASEHMMSQLDARQLSLCLWALAVLRHVPSEAWLGSWAEAMGRCGWQVQVGAGAAGTVGYRQQDRQQREQRVLPGDMSGAAKAGGSVVVLETPASLADAVSGPKPVMASGSIDAAGGGLSGREGPECGDEGEAITRRISFACGAFGWQCSN
jgi:hypothetical protein